MKLWHNDEPLNYHLGFMKNVMYWKPFKDLKKLAKRVFSESKIIDPVSKHVEFLKKQRPEWVSDIGQDVGQFYRRNVSRVGEALVRPKKYAGTGAGTGANILIGATAPFNPFAFPMAVGYGAQAGRAHGGGTRGMLYGGLRGAMLGAGGAGAGGALAGGFSGATAAGAGFGAKLAGAGTGAWQGAGQGLAGYRETIPGFGKGGMWNRPASEFAGVAAEPTGAVGTAGTGVGAPASIASDMGAAAAEPASQGIWDSLWGGAKNIGKAYLGQNIVSAGLRLASGGVPTAEPSMEARDMYGDIYSQVSEGGATPTGRIGTEKLGEMAAGEGWTELDQNRYDMAATNLDEDLDKKLTEMEKMYAAYGALDSGQYREEVMRMRDEASNLKQQMLYEMQAAGMSRQMTAVAKAVDYDVNTVNQLFGIAGQIGADEEMRANLKNQNYDQLRRDLNTLAYAAEGGGATTTNEKGEIVDPQGRVLSDTVMDLLFSFNK